MVTWKNVALKGKIKCENHAKLICFPTFSGESYHTVTLGLSGLSVPIETIATKALYDRSYCGLLFPCFLSSKGNTSRQKAGQSVQWRGDMSNKARVAKMRGCWLYSLLKRDKIAGAEWKKDVSTPRTKWCKSSDELHTCQAWLNFYEFHSEIVN